MAMAQGNGIASPRCRRAGPGGDVAQSRSRHRRTAALDDHRHRFLDLAIARGVLRFGQFELKSGRTSPYFFNAGLFDTGAALAELGACYAEALAAAGLPFDMLFGPAYKGIPLATTLAVELARRGVDVPVAFNRKEAKAHGEGGLLSGVLIALDRQERGQAGARSAAQEVTAEFGLPVVAIAGLDDLLAHADERPAIAMHRAALEAYRARYGRQAD